MRDMGRLADMAEASPAERERLLAAMTPVRVRAVDDMSDTGRALVSKLRERVEKFRSAATRELASETT